MAGVMSGSDKGCSDLRSSNTVLLLGAIPLDVRMWHALENKPS